MTIRIDIPTSSLDPSVRESIQRDINEGRLDSSGEVRVIPVPAPSQNAFPGEETLAFILDFSTAVGSGVISNWLYTKLNEKKVWIKIGSVQVLASDLRALEKIIERESKDDDAGQSG